MIKLVNILLESTEEERLKDKMISMIPNELQENEDEITKSELSSMINNADLSVEDLKLLIPKFDVLLKKGNLEKSTFEKLFKSDYSKRLQNTKTKKKTLPISKVESFKELIDDHYKSPGTLKIFKWLNNQLFNLEYDVKTIMDYIDLVSDPSNLISYKNIVSQTGITNIDNLISPKLASNKFYQNTKDGLFNLNDKGIGKGEALLIVYGSNSGLAPSNRGDVIIDEKFIEVKSGVSAASIDSGISSAKFNVDAHNNVFLKRLGKTQDEIDKLNTFSSGKKKKAVESPLFYPSIRSEMSVKDFYDYIKPFYEGGLETSEIENLSKDLFNNKDKDFNSIKEIMFPYIFQLYKEKKQFDSIVVIKPNGDFIPITNIDNIPSSLKIKDWSLKQGGDNQSLPRGYMNITF
jgi:hypothetical protein|tara:strand:- start:20 stop:1234 length:1215 start_codon:yes stop_codon:yes gene_type:complete